MASFTKRLYASFVWCGCYVVPPVFMAPSEVVSHRLYVWKRSFVVETMSLSAVKTDGTCAFRTDRLLYMYNVNYRWSAEVQAASTSISSLVQAPDTLRVILTSFIVITTAEFTRRLTSLSATMCVTLTSPAKSYITLLQKLYVWQLCTCHFSHHVMSRTGITCTISLPL